MTIQPIRNHILIRLVKSEDTQTRGGLYIPQTAVERPQEAVVIATSPGYYEQGQWIEMPVSVGHHILIGKYSGSVVSVDGAELVFIHAEDILGVIEEEVA